MHIVQIVGSIHNLSAGPSYSIARLGDELCSAGCDVSLLTPGRFPEAWPYRVRLDASSGWLDNQVGVSPAFIRKIRDYSGRTSIMHGHGIWRFANNVFPLVVDRQAPAKIVCSPRGTMSSWSMQYKGIVKRPFWRFVQKPALERCKLFHATAVSEYEDIRRVGLQAPVAIIPNGVDIPELPVDRVRKRRVVFLGRINPVKGIDMLINAWLELQARFPDWELVIAGPLDEDYAAEMKKLAQSAGENTNIRFTGEVQGDEKKSLLSGASLFVLPSHSENFGMVVAEALSHGVPVITTTGTPWSDLQTRGCGWYVAPEQGVLSAAMQEAMSRPLVELQVMGEKGREWMRRDYSWEHVAGMMFQAYQWLLQSDRKPEYVVTK